MDLTTIRKNQSKKIRTNKTTISYVETRINNKGFEYCFDNYEDFSLVEDKNFHIYLKNYINAKKKLREYIVCCAQQERIDTKLGLPLYKRQIDNEISGDVSGDVSDDDKSDTKSVTA